jgi:DNA repair exonuclease SbcCD nuclease subunit
VTMVRLLHAADCHLGSSPSRREEAAFKQLVDLAKEEQVDADLIAGDLFNANRIKHETVEWADKQLARLACEIVILPGNRDALVGDTVYRRCDASRSGARLSSTTRQGGRYCAGYISTTAGK